MNIETEVAVMQKRVEHLESSYQQGALKGML